MGHSTLAMSDKGSAKPPKKKKKTSVGDALDGALANVPEHSVLGIKNDSDNDEEVGDAVVELAEAAEGGEAEEGAKESKDRKTRMGQFMDPCLQVVGKALKVMNVPGRRYSVLTIKDCVPIIVL